jgi:hypothetical protein
MIIENKQDKNKAMTGKEFLEEKGIKEAKRSFDGYPLGYYELKPEILEEYHQAKLKSMANDDSKFELLFKFGKFLRKWSNTLLSEHYIKDEINIFLELESKKATEKN